MSYLNMGPNASDSNTDSISEMELQGQRIFGTETEYGCFVKDDGVGSSEQASEVVKNWIFNKMKHGAIDLHARDEAFEPARSGGFLINGARLYIDAVGSHEEYATAECMDIFDLVAQERAGQRILTQALKEIGWEDKVGFYNNSVDHFAGHTFGCHENYLIQAESKFFTDSVRYLFPFLVTRQIFSGVGRVGGHILEQTNGKLNYAKIDENPLDYIWVSNIYAVEPDKSVEFQLSQRADHIIKTIASRVRFNRAIINPKWDSFYNYNNMHRLHLLYGEANMSQYASALKIGTTCLVLDLLELQAVPKKVVVKDVLQTLRAVSRDAAWRWLVTLEDGSTMPAVDLQRLYLKAAKKRFAGRDEQTDWILKEWEYVLDKLESNPLQLSDRIDWVIKRNILETYMKDTGMKWSDDALHSIDMEYHNINPDYGLYYALEQMGKVVRIISEERIASAMNDAPENTRAYGRSKVIKQLVLKRAHRYYVDWDMVYIDRNRILDLRNPFDTHSASADEFCQTF